MQKNNNSYLAPPYFNNSVTRYKGISWNLTLGQDLTLSNKNSLGWYLSYRNTQIKQNGYDAPASQFLMKYNNIKWTVHSLASGIKWNYSITTKLTWLNNIEIEHQIKSNVTGAVQIENLKHDYHLNIHKTQWSISSGLNYQFSPKFSVSLTPYIKNGLISSKQWGTYLSLEGKF
ncbi:autotransporter domain-containing protein [Haemophilus haemolyticus]|uniref:autotransporter domain-containing protein n=1 Tax=Haemophilus haemolyticus TaxID=726 RepID=UPI0018642722|nr:autotransporter domain-containing protein [Haemophilus haemolyticus]